MKETPLYGREHADEESRRPEASAYAKLVRLDPHLSGKVGRRLERKGMSEMLNNLKAGSETIRALGGRETDLIGLIREVRSCERAAMREHSEDAAVALAVLLADMERLFDNIRMLKELPVLDPEGIYGFDPAMIESAIRRSRAEVELLVGRLHALELPSALQKAFHYLRERVLENILVIGAALGIVFVTPVTSDEGGVLRQEQVREEAQHQEGERPTNYEGQHPGNKPSHMTDNRQKAPQPHMGGSGEQAGQMEKGTAFAQIEGNMPDFFMTRVYHFDDKGERVFISNPAHTEASGALLGTVRIAPQAYQEGATVHLPIPFGYRPIGIRADGETLFEQQQGTNTLVISNITERPVSFSYSVVKSTNDGSFLRGSRIEFPARADRVKKLRQEAARRPAHLDNVFREYLGDFTYIASSDVQNIIGSIRGDAAYKAGFIPVGDCGVLSDHVSWALQGRLDSGVAIGYMNVDGDAQLSTGEGHARMIYRSANGEARQVETTAHVKNRFINLRLLEEDRRELQRRVEAINGNEDQVERERMMTEFHKDLERILEKKEYREFQPGGNFVDVLKNILKSGEVSWEHMNRWKNLNPYIAALGLSALLSSLGAGSFFGARKVVRAQGVRLRRRDIEKDIDLLEDLELMTGAAEKSTGPVDEMFAKMCARFHINQSIVQNLSAEEKGILIVLERIRSQGAATRFVPYRFIRERLDMGRFHASVAALAQSGGVPTEQIYRVIKDMFESKEFRRDAEEVRDMQVENIWRQGQSILSAIGNIPTSQALNTLFVGAGSSSSPLQGNRKITGNEEYRESRPYVRGDELRRLDWKQVGKTDRLIMKEFEEGEGGVSGKQFYLVVDLPSVDFKELHKLAAFLILISKHRTIGMAGMDFYAFGKIVRHFDKAALQKAFGGTTSAVGAKKILEVLLQERIDSSILTSSSFQGSWANVQSGMLLPADIPASARRSGTVITMGARRLARPDNITKVIEFRTDTPLQKTA